MVEATIRALDRLVSFKSVHASRGKVVRAEPIAALYEQRKVHHVGNFSTLEDQMCAFTSDFDRGRNGYSPDRVDALVWALTELSGPQHTTSILPFPF
jgi:phage terminase large subunit-like protein